MNNNQEETGPKHVFMFEFPKKNLSAVNYGIYFKSSSCFINNLTWRIMITKKKSDDISKDPADTLSIYLECSGKSQFWTCAATVRLTLLSQTPHVKDLSREFQHLFSSLSYSRGYPTFIGWDKLHGFIKDDMIKIQAYVTAETPKNISIIDYNIKEPQSCDDWLSLFESKLNDKIVRRISEEIKTVKDEVKSIVKLPEEIKALNEKVERLDNRNIRIMSEFLKKSLEVVITSFFKKIDSLQLEEKLDSFHAEMTSVFEEIRQIIPQDSDVKGSEKLSKGNDEVDTDGEGESGTIETEETAALSEENEETETDSVIIEEKVIETFDISDSDSDNDEKIDNKSASCEGAKEKMIPFKPTVVEESTAVPALDFFKVYGRPNEFIAQTCSEIKSASQPCSAHVHSKCEASSHLQPIYGWYNQVEAERKVLKYLKRKRENDNSTVVHWQSLAKKK